MLNGENRMKIKIGWLFVTVLMLTSCGGIRSVRIKSISDFEEEITVAGYLFTSENIITSPNK